MTLVRCPWANSSRQMRDYHDHEWGVPLYDEQKLFEFLCLEGAQAGLSWQTILKRRDNYRQAFCDFQIDKVANMTSDDIETLMQNPGIIRNRLKIKSVINNAQVWLQLSKTQLMVEALWQFSPKEAIIYREHEMIPAFTEESKQMSKWLKSQGFSFVGPTICYAFIQATGMVNDHLSSCFVFDAK
ncbi:DNA-3-methyladenine glycosylase I [Cysteiniphilum sp. QT6929]|uniref:DNA-3-methyladenine glycosylase I n=1 Tax=Cysteiniphilum sp. QT6929 TaxID=2975055 RepID=UPI0024B32966|nr:DNA-3-methyladenine glycosylase I [Cysteiniphilum sp. QT6929]WHN65644.1 DNA-3-methyladenine glycosylase I [Cysteiniphilum sp. QT6929]